MKCSHPIAIMSFNRPGLLKDVLLSIKDQTVDIDPHRLFLFQDGAYPDTPEAHAAQTECISIFRDIFPKGSVMDASENLGVAFNFDRAETHVFEGLGAEAAIFFEDDLLLGPHYLEALLQLTRFALDEPRVAYAAAYGNHRAPLGEQKRRASEITRLGHKWGFVLTRRQWLAQKEIVDGYLDILRGRNYRSRPHTNIIEYFQNLGYGVKATSQDAAKDAASFVIGTVKINTFPCFARYIGKVGLHSNEAFFEREGFDNTEIYNDNMPTFDFPSSTLLDQWVDEDRRRLASPRKTMVTNMSITPAQALCLSLFGDNPYEGFEPVIEKPDLQGWNGGHPALSRIVRETKPEVIVDVGVWKGRSAVTLAAAQKEVRESGIVIAVDSFLGSPEHWNPKRQDIFAALRFSHGQPRLYDIFLSNIRLLQLEDQVVPIVQTSENAALILRRLGITPELVHIDAAHEYGSVMRDIETYYELIRPGGVLIGDDFVWSGVARAVVHFTDRLGLPFHVEYPKWWIFKPAV